MESERIAMGLLATLARGDLDAAGALLTDDFTFEGPVPQPVPKQGFLAFERAVQSAFDGYAYNPRVESSSAEHVDATLQITATHARTLALPMPGIAPVSARGARITLPPERTRFTLRGGLVSRIAVEPTPGGGVPGLLASIATAPSPDDAPFVLYAHPVSGTSYKAALALALCGQAFTVRHVELFLGAHKQPQYLAVNRYGQVPALAHRGQVVVQSNVILQYLAESLGRLGGEGDARWKVREWLAWEADVLLPGTALTWSLQTYKGVLFPDDPDLVAFFRQRGQGALETLEAQLRKTPWLAGDALTVADLACFAYADRWEEVGLDLGAFVAVKGWLARVRETPGFRTRAELIG